MKCLHPKFAGENKYYNCGKCIACREIASIQWAKRIEDELSYNKDNCYITLTYDTAHLPSNNEAFKRDVTLFVKRLRKYLGSGCRIKYFIAAEFGELHDRPHLHGVIMGWLPDDKLFFKLNKGNMIYTSDILSSLWGKGFITLGNAEIGSIRYMLKYIMKQNGWSLKSNGIGEKHVTENYEKYIMGEMPDKTIPRYYVKKIREYWHDFMDTDEHYQSIIDKNNAYEIKHKWKRRNKIEKEDVDNQRRLILEIEKRLERPEYR